MLAIVSIGPPSGITAWRNSSTSRLSRKIRSACVRARAREHLHLDLVDVGLDAAGRVLVHVDDVVGDRVQHLGGPDGQPLGIGLELAADRGQVAALTVADGDHVVDADEDHHLAELEHLVVVDVAQRLQHDEQRVVVPLELRALMGVHGVLDGQRVQLVELGDVLQLDLASAPTCRST